MRPWLIERQRSSFVPAANPAYSSSSFATTAASSSSSSSSSTMTANQHRRVAYLQVPSPSAAMDFDDDSNQQQQGCGVWLEMQLERGAALRWGDRKQAKEVEVEEAEKATARRMLVSAAASSLSSSSRQQHNGKQQQQQRSRPQSRNNTKNNSDRATTAAAKQGHQDKIYAARAQGGERWRLTSTDLWRCLVAGGPITIDAESPPPSTSTTAAAAAGKESANTSHHSKGFGVRGWMGNNNNNKSTDSTSEHYGQDQHEQAMPAKLTLLVTAEPECRTESRQLCENIVEEFIQRTLYAALPSDPNAWAAKINSMLDEDGATLRSSKKSSMGSHSTLFGDSFATRISVRPLDVLHDEPLLPLKKEERSGGLGFGSISSGAGGGGAEQKQEQQNLQALTWLTQMDLFVVVRHRGRVKAVFDSSRPGWKDNIDTVLKGVKAFGLGDSALPKPNGPLPFKMVGTKMDGSPVSGGEGEGASCVLHLPCPVWGALDATAIQASNLPTEWLGDGRKQRRKATSDGEEGGEEGGEDNGEDGDDLDKEQEGGGDVGGGVAFGSVMMGDDVSDASSLPTDRSPVNQQEEPTSGSGRMGARRKGVHRQHEDDQARKGLSVWSPKPDTAALGWRAVTLEVFSRHPSRGRANPMFRGQVAIGYSELERVAASGYERFPLQKRPDDSARGVRVRLVFTPPPPPDRKALKQLAKDASEEEAMDASGSSAGGGMSTLFGSLEGGGVSRPGTAGSDNGGSALNDDNDQAFNYSSGSYQQPTGSGRYGGYFGYDNDNKMQVRTTLPSRSNHSVPFAPPRHPPSADSWDAVAAAARTHGPRLNAKVVDEAWAAEATHAKRQADLAVEEAAAATDTVTKARLTFIAGELKRRAAEERSNPTTNESMPDRFDIAGSPVGARAGIGVTWADGDDNYDDDEDGLGELASGRTRMKAEGAMDDEGGCTEDVCRWEDADVVDVPLRVLLEKLELDQFSEALESQLGLESALQLKDLTDYELTTAVRVWNDIESAKRKAVNQKFYDEAAAASKKAKEEEKEAKAKGAPSSPTKAAAAAAAADKNDGDDVHDDDDGDNRGGEGSSPKKRLAAKEAAEEEDKRRIEAAAEMLPMLVRTHLKKIRTALHHLGPRVHPGDNPTDGDGDNDTVGAILFDSSDFKHNCL
jgi:hypothetical protein